MSSLILLIGNYVGTEIHIHFVDYNAIKTREFKSIYKLVLHGNGPKAQINGPKANSLHYTYVKHITLLASNI